ncbi:hypothetical protein [Psychrobacter sp. DM4]|uniref:hypothetical protein n=1 Tax=Psychrobacter sp. DM4 TaxID=3440637 RepID=UPI003F508EAE
MSLRVDLKRHNTKILKVSLIISSALLFVGCSKEASVAEDAAATVTSDLSVFDGCYTVSRDEPAQIKVSEIDGTWMMQMKEPASSGRVWDNPEPLEVLDNSEIPTYFSIDPDNVDALIARPDRVLVLAHVKPVYANIDPLLDSEYLSYIYRGANTIYHVECDDINTDILANPHSNIVIDNVNEIV